MKGMSLSEKGLVNALDKANYKDSRVKADYSTSITANSEAEIFEYLGLDYVAPEDRSV
jgi:DNA polymerase/3'-5' exonuclease PolX